MNFKLRKNADPGEWCSILLPSCMLSLNFSHGGELYLYFFVICAWLAVANFLSKRIFKDGFGIEHYHCIFFLICSVLVSLFVWKFFSFHNCFFHVITLNYLSLWCYTYILRTLLEKCPGSFTWGEAEILTQGIVLFFLCSELFLFRKINPDENFFNFMEVSDHVKCLQVLFLGCLSLIFLTYSFQSLRRVQNFFALFILTSMLMVIAWRLYLGENIFVWILEFCLHSHKRVYLLLFWMACTVFCITFVVIINMSSVHSGSSFIRKVFHFVITSVYVPGILYDLELLRLASGIAFAAFLMLELCRVLKIPPVGSAIENAFQIFLDEKDTGLLILTHIYLLIGCSFPIWMCCYDSERKSVNICLMSGILSVGIGDTVAAICGKSFGRHKWKDTEKTIEGSISCFMIQMILGLIFLSVAGHSFTSYNISLLAIAVMSTTYLEAKTNQVDNLVLPLFMFSILSLIQ